MIEDWPKVSCHWGASTTTRKPTRKKSKKSKIVVATPSPRLTQ
jgi:hypothetical protein